LILLVPGSLKVLKSRSKSVSPKGMFLNIYTVGLKGGTARQISFFLSTSQTLSNSFAYSHALFCTSRSAWFSKLLTIFRILSLIPSCSLNFSYSFSRVDSA